jgi:predicted enzyme related to lactoylglutathione lyase
MKTPITWFELPAQDLGRARKFYETVLDVTLRAERFGPMQLEMAIFPKSDAVGGALVKGERFRPSRDGAIVYLDANGGLDRCLAKVEEAGGKVVQPRTDIGAPGFIALFVDTEGNRGGLHEARAA